MAWPFPEYIRPLMRSALWYHSRGHDWDDIAAILTAPPNRHSASDVELALPEARRSWYFAEQLRAAPGDSTFGEVWDRCAEDCFRFGYNREPQGAELGWWRTRPGRTLGLMYELTSPQVPNWRWTPTLNAAWDARINDTGQLIRQWFLAGLPSPPPPNSITTALGVGAQLDVQIVGGALVPRVEPTLQMQRGDR